MANWIKVDVSTPYKPAIARIAETCGKSRAEAFLAWFELWAWFDSLTSTGTVNCTREEIDRRTFRGMAAALELSGWIVCSRSSVRIVNWQEHNDSSAKARSDRMRVLAKRRWEPG